MPAASALRAEKAIAERSRGAHPCVAQLASSSSRYGTAPAILAESCRMKACASEPRAPRTLTAKVRSRKRGAPGRWGGMVYWLGARVRSRRRGAAHTDGKGQEPQARRTRLVGWDGILARRQGPLEVAVRRAPRGVRVLARDPGVTGTPSL